MLRGNATCYVGMRQGTLECANRRWNARTPLECAKRRWNAEGGVGMPQGGGRLNPGGMGGVRTRSIADYFAWLRDCELSVEE